ncbi:MAG: Rrf2 family transcriptional regulator [Chitinivibrionales bacterium]|nr:Rrf2 family transcriptional regulator [Chitinivibrionales bacterium]
MKLSTKSRYGVRAILEIARDYERTPTKRKNIVAKQNISDAYLENILIMLKNNGIIDTVRGARGGYVLSRPPAAITLLEIVRALEGSIAPVDCLDNKSLCVEVPWCSARKVWKQLYDSRVAVLEKTTLQDLLDSDETATKNDYCI